MNFGADCRQAIRMLRRNPTASAIIIVTLALCIGANTAIFSVVDATFLRPLPYPQPDRLARIVRHFEGRGAESDDTGQDGRTWELIRDHATFLDAAVFSDGASGVNFSAAEAVQYIKQQRIGAGYFGVLGVRPFMGREFSALEDTPGGPPVAILSFSLWRNSFHSDNSVIGKSLLLRGEPYAIIGVMPESFHTNEPVSLWTPLYPSPKGEGSGTNYAILARLKSGVNWAQADSQIESIEAAVFQAEKPAPDVRARLHIVPLLEGETGDIRKPLLIVWAAVGLVLLIGCANIASLLLARAASRSREIATRLALGGGRGAILRQLLVESLVLALMGGAAGVVVGSFALRALKALGSQEFASIQSAHLDGRVLAVTAFVAILVSFLAGILPALDAGDVDLRSALSKAGGRGVSGARQGWARKFLVAGEIALAVVLLIGAGLLIRTLAHFYQLSPGFDPSNVITASFSLQDSRYDAPGRVTQFYESGLVRIRALPGVEAAGAGLTLPYEIALNMGFRRVDGPEALPRGFTTNVCYVTPGYIEALRVPLLRGRAIQSADTATSPPVVLVNDAFVKRYFTQQDALGLHIRFGGNSPPREIVGVVSDVQQAARFGDFGPFGSVPAVYIPVSQTESELLKMVHVWFTPSWVIRVSGSPAVVTRGIENAATAIDPLLPIAEFRSIDQVRATTLSSQRFQTILLGSLSVLALVLAIVGIYGLMSNSVLERRRELGIRIALGSTLNQAIREAARPGVVLALAGIAAGCILAALTAKVLQHYLWGITATDSVTYAAVALGLLLVAAVASLLPAMRIARLNPADTLREE